MKVHAPEKDAFDARWLAARQGRAMLVDPHGIAHVARLLEAAEGGPTSARMGLFEAADRALARIEARTQAADARVRRRIEASSLRGRDTSAPRDAYAEGELAAAVRRVTRDALRPPEAPEPSMPRALARARAAGIEPSDHGDAPFETLAAAYDAAAGRLDASLARARLAESAPPIAGRYHARAVLCELVEVLDSISPVYLAGLFDRLSALGALDAFARSLEPATQAPATPAAKPSRETRNPRSPSASPKTKARGRGRSTAKRISPVGARTRR